jgi:hypothetical protein
MEVIELAPGQLSAAIVGTQLSGPIDCRREKEVY